MKPITTDTGRPDTHVCGALHQSIEGQLPSANVNVQNQDGETALHLALSNGEDFARLLLENGADVNAQNVFGETSLDQALSDELWDLVTPIPRADKNINYDVKIFTETSGSSEFTHVPFVEVEINNVVMVHLSASCTTACEGIAISGESRDWAQYEAQEFCTGDSNVPVEQMSFYHECMMD